MSTYYHVRITPITLQSISLIWEYADKVFVEWMN